MQQLLRRQIDFWGALLGLIILAIPSGLIVMAMKLSSKGLGFFRQERVGKDGRSFRVWKFCTMVVGAIDQGLGVTVAKNDQRITSVGSILCNLGVDELPRLINVLVGGMSLVGPRLTVPWQGMQLQWVTGSERISVYRYAGFSLRGLNSPSTV